MGAVGATGSGDSTALEDSEASRFIHSTWISSGSVAVKRGGVFALLAGWATGSVVRVAVAAGVGGVAVAVAVIAGRGVGGVTEAVVAAAVTVAVGGGTERVLTRGRSGNVGSVGSGRLAVTVAAPGRRGAGAGAAGGRRGAVVAATGGVGRAGVVVVAMRSALGVGLAMVGVAGDEDGSGDGGPAEFGSGADGGAGDVVAAGRVAGAGGDLRFEISDFRSRAAVGGGSGAGTDAGAVDAGAVDAAGFAVSDFASDAAWEAVVGAGGVGAAARDGAGED